VISCPSPLFRAVIGLAAVGITACDPSGNETPRVPRPDSWELGSHHAAAPRDCATVDPVLIIRVPLRHRSRAIDRLQNTTIVELSQQEAVAFLDLADTPANTPRPFLVRAIVKNEVAGRFDVTACADGLHVIHASLGQDIPPSTRLPIVVFLDRRPATVYVEWQMAR
jgi:hypothetical protein